MEIFWIVILDNMLAHIEFLSISCEIVMTHFHQVTSHYMIQYTKLTQIYVTIWYHKATMCQPCHMFCFSEQNTASSV